MAYDNTYFVKRAGEIGAFRSQIWDYDTIDTQGDMNTAGYFTAANSTTNKRGVKVGDYIWARVWTTSIPTSINSGTLAGVFLLTVNAAGAVGAAVDVVNGTSFDMTDSD